MLDQVFQLSDGRMLGYALYGPADGKPVLYFHGTPSSRLEPVLLSIYNINREALLQQYKIRLIAIDRPGLGISSYDEKKSFLSVARDAHELLTWLEVSRCAVLCWSGGGPYALAMAYRYPEMVQGVYFIAAFSNSFGVQDVYDQLGWNRMYFNTARRAPLVLQGALSAMRHIKVHFPISQSLYDLSNEDYALMKDADKINPLLKVTIKEAVREGAKGAVQDAQLYFKEFGFSLRDIEVPVHFWWGTKDNIVTYVHAKHLERYVPQVIPHYKINEGHLSIYVHCFEEVLQTIAAV